MAKTKKLVWTSRAKAEKQEILEFWLEHNKSIAYPQKLNTLFDKALDLVKTHPKIGKRTDISDDIRIKIVRDYEIFYQITTDNIYVLSIWDTRRNPEDFNF